MDGILFICLSKWRARLRLAAHYISQWKHLVQFNAKISISPTRPLPRNMWPDISPATVSAYT